ncbi:hypothetical protein EG329_004961 [Mollisiaceae sp. DMI_Dod_QoI]|nr:hypothetical protein EG329_004961 [Helotiales sp. DMI_Dod_QoI]
MADETRRFSGTGSPLYFAEQTQGRTFEHFMYHESPIPVTLEGDISDESFSAWLTKDLNKLSSSGESQAPVRGLRLILIPYKFMVSQILCTKAIAEALATHMHNRRYLFPDPVHHATCLSHCYSTSDTNSQTYIGLALHLPTCWQETYGACTIFYNRNTQIVHVLISSADNIFGLGILETLRSLTKKDQDWINPLSIPLKILESMIDSCHFGLRDNQALLQAMNAATGQFKYINLPPSDPFKEDFMSTTQSLNTISQNAGLVTSLLISLKKAVKNLQKFKKFVEDLEQNKTSTIESLRVDEKIDIITEQCDSMLLEAQRLEKAASNLLQVVYSFIAQKDAKASIEISNLSAQLALNSKRDSSAMKTISIVGMLFLPGTFIAAIFSMPVFNWEGNGTPIAKPAFGYYWAIMLPLTTVVLVVWSLVTFLPWKKWIADRKERKVEKPDAATMNSSERDSRSDTGTINSSERGRRSEPV